MGTSGENTAARPAAHGVGCKSRSEALQRARCGPEVLRTRARYSRSTRARTTESATSSLPVYSWQPGVH